MSSSLPPDPARNSVPPVGSGSSFVFSPGAIGENGPTGGAASAGENDLVQQTRNEIRRLIGEIATLAQSNVPLDEFLAGFLSRTVSSLASVGGAAWLRDDNQQIELAYQIALPTAAVIEDPKGKTRHELLLRKLFENPEPILLAPLAGSQDEGEPGNPTEHLLILAPVVVNGEVAAIIEIFQRPGGGPTTQRGYVRFLVQMCEHATEYFRNRWLRLMHERQQLWGRLDHFLRASNQSLDLRPTCFALANEGRRVVDADRISIGIFQDQRCVIHCVSGLDSFDRRAEEIRLMTMLAEAVCKSNSNFYFEGGTETVAPQIEVHLHKYVDLSHSKRIAVIPLYKATPQKSGEERPSTTKQCVGCLVVEQLSDKRLDSATRERIEIVAGHAGRILGNVLEHNSLFMLPVWKRVSSLVSLFNKQNLPTTTLVIAALFAVIAGLTFTPYDFELSATGQLTPSARHEKFAPINGIVASIEVPDAPHPRVKKDQVILTLQNDQLDQQIQQLESQMKQSRAKFQAARDRLRAQRSKLTELERQQLQAEETQELQNESHYRELLQLKVAQKDKLQILSPIDGEIVNWDLYGRLLKRPIQEGQNLVTIVDPNSPWEIELQLPEARFKHVYEAYQDGDVIATYWLHSAPGRKLTGKVTYLDPYAGVTGEEGNTMIVRIAVEDGAIADELKVNGTKVTARLDCGTRSVGYTLFHDVWDTIQSRVLFWF